MLGASAFGKDATRGRLLLEAGLWMAGLTLMALADPTSEPWIDACLFKAVGLPGCPGCGLGHGIAWLARGEWNLALQAHPASPVVVVVLAHRIARCMAPNLSIRSLIR